MTEDKKSTVIAINYDFYAPENRELSLKMVEKLVPHTCEKCFLVYPRWDPETGIVDDHVCESEK